MSEGTDVHYSDEQRRAAPSVALPVHPPHRSSAELRCVAPAVGSDLLLLAGSASLVLAYLTAYEAFSEPSKAPGLVAVLCAGLGLLGACMWWSVLSHPFRRELIWDGSASRLQMTYHYFGRVVTRTAGPPEIGELVWLVFNEGSENDVRYLHIELRDGGTFEMPMSLATAETLASAIERGLTEQKKHNAWIATPAPAPLRSKAHEVLRASASQG